MLKKLRGNKSINMVSEETGISVRSLRAYEQGTRNPTDSKKVILSRYYNESVEYIFFNHNMHK